MDDQFRAIVRRNPVLRLRLRLIACMGRRRAHPYPPAMVAIASTCGFVSGYGCWARL